MSTLSMTAYAASVHWQSRAELGEAGLRALLAQMLEGIAHKCETADHRVIGHVKALAVFPDGGYLRVSVADPARPADILGDVSGQHRSFALILNVLVYGPSLDEVDQIVRGCLDALALRRDDLYSVEDFNSHPEATGA